MAVNEKLLSGSPNTTTLKFPIYDRGICINGKMMYFKKHIRTFPRELVAYLIDRLSCIDSSCPSKVFSAVDKPHTLSCGHYVHEGCFDSRKSASSKTDCSCAKFPNVKKTKRPDEVLGKIFTELERDGYRCHDCNDLHPRLNSVYWVDYEKEDNSSPYYCVWCVADNADHSGKEFRLIKEKPEDEPSDERGTTERLRSLDCNQVKFLNAWVLCCHCLDSLIENWDYNKCKYLDCGHISHEKHLEEALFCHFANCEKEVARPKDQRDCRINEYQDGFGHGFDLLDSVDCSKCKDSHPKSNCRGILKYVCVWCTVMENDKKRLKKLKKKKKKNVKSGLSLE